MLIHLSRRIGVDADWCTLAEAGLGVEMTKLCSHLVNTFIMHIDACYFASVKGPNDTSAPVTTLPSGSEGSGEC